MLMGQFLANLSQSSGFERIAWAKGSVNDSFIGKLLKLMGERRGWLISNYQDNSLDKITSQLDQTGFYLVPIRTGELQNFFNILTTESFFPLSINRCIIHLTQRD